MNKFPFEVKPLEKEDRSAFDCGTEALNRYLAQQARQDMKRRVATCFVSIHQESQSIAGFYTLSASQILLSDLDEVWAKRLPKYPTVPSVLLGRLAIHKDFQKQGLGGAMLFDAVKRVLQSEIAINMFVVDAKHDNAKMFYQHHGFHQAPEGLSRMFVPVSDLAKKVENA